MRLLTQFPEQKQMLLDDPSLIRKMNQEALRMHGPHKCLGSRIAQLQLRIAYEKILDRFPNITWTGEQTIAPNNFVHAILSFKVRL